LFKHWQGIDEFELTEESTIILKVFYNTFFLILAIIFIEFPYKITGCNRVVVKNFEMQILFENCRRQCHQHYTRAYFADIMAPKNYKAKCY